MIARRARELSDDAAQAEALLETWPPTPEQVGKVQAALTCLRISLRTEADLLLVEELTAFGEPL